MINIDLNDYPKLVRELRREHSKDALPFKRMTSFEEFFLQKYGFKIKAIPGERARYVQIDKNDLILLNLKWS